MTLDLRQNFASAHYLENKLIELHQILYMHPYWQALHWDCYIFCTFIPELWPMIYAKITFGLIILRTDWQNFTKFYIFSPNFIYALILTRSSLGLWHIFFSSPVTKWQGELLWSVFVRRQAVNFWLKQQLLLSPWHNFEIISHIWSLGSPLPILFKWFWSVAYLGHRG